jgi:outer membrane receptor protein involved in Fe transport
MGSILSRNEPSGKAGTIHTRTQATTWLLLAGAYTFNTQSASDDPNAPSLAFGLPRHQGSVQATSHLGRHLDASVVVMVASTYIAPISDAVTFVSRSFRFDGVHRLDLSASYAMPFASRRRVRVFGRIDNVTDQTYFESGFRTPGRVAAMGLAVEF